MTRRPLLLPLVLAALLGAAGLAGCSLDVLPGAGRAEEPSRKAPGGDVLKRAETFAVYFGGRADSARLAGYDVAILDPDAHAPEDVAALRAAGLTTVAYLNVGEAETYRWFYDRVDPDWLIGPNPNWADHYYVDAREAGWRALLLDEVAPAILARGFDGLFLDMVDTAVAFEETRPGMVRLVRALRDRFPDALLVQNNGLPLMTDVGAVLDAVHVESLYATYDFAAERYVRVEAGWQADRLARLKRHRDAYDLAVLVTDYADDEALRAYARSRAARDGFPIFLSTIALNTL